MDGFAAAGVADAFRRANNENMASRLSAVMVSPPSRELNSANRVSVTPRGKLTPDVTFTARSKSSVIK